MKIYWKSEKIFAYDVAKERTEDTRKKKIPQTRAVFCSSVDGCTLSPSLTVIELNIKQRRCIKI